MTITAVGSLSQTRGTGVVSLTPTTPTTGNMLVLAVRVNSASITVSSVAGGLVGSWSTLAGFTDALTSARVELWFGSVTGSGSGTVTVAFSGSVSAISTELVSQEFHSSITGATWGIAATGATTDGTGTALSFPSRAGSGLYFGFGYVANTGAAGSTSGFTYAVTGASNVVTYNPTASGTVAPTATQSPSGNWFTVGGMLVDVAPLPSSMNANYPVIEEGWGPAWTAQGGALPVGSWVNVVDRTLTQSNARRGKQYELDQPQSGEYQITLGSQDGVLDPTNTSGPYGGKILPYQPYRRRAQWPPTPNVLPAVIANGGEGVTGSPALTTLGFNLPTSGISAGIWTSAAWQGSNSFEFIVPNATPANSGIFRTDMVAIRPGKTLTFSAYLANITASTSIPLIMYVSFLNADGTAVWGNGFGLTLAGNSTATWSRVTVTATAPTTGAVYGVRIGLNVGGSATTAQSAVLVDGMQVEWASAATAWTSPGTWYPIFSGFTERWPTQWADGGTYGQVSPTGVDAFALLSQVTLDQTFAHEIQQYSPRFLYKFSEVAGATLAADWTGVNPSVGLTTAKGGNGNTTFGNSQTSTTATGGFVGTDETVVSFRQAGSGINASEPVATFNLNDAGISGPVDSGSGYSRMLAFRYAGASLPADGAYLWSAYWSPIDNSGLGWLTAGVQLFIDSDGKLKLKCNEFLQSSATIVNSGVVVTEGDWHLAGFTVNGTAVRIFLDGSVVAVVTLPAGVGTGGMTDTLGCNFGPNTRTAKMTFYGDISYVTEFPSVLNATAITALYNAWKNAFSGESSDSRYARILRYSGYKGASNIGAGMTTSMGAATGLVGTDAMSALNDVASTENGEHFVAADGTITFRGRGARYNALTPVLVFGDGPGELPFEDLQLDFDSTHLSNVVTVTQTPTGQNFPAADSASQAAYYTRTMTRSLNTTNAYECQDAADYLVSRYKAPVTRVQSIKLHPSAAPSLWPSLLALELGTRVRINRRPPGAPTVTVDCFVEQITWDMDGGNEAWITLQCSPIDPNPYGQFSDTLPQFDQALFAY